jgi:hypothetical protein
MIYVAIHDHRQLCRVGEAVLPLPFCIGVSQNAKSLNDLLRLWINKVGNNKKGGKESETTELFISISYYDCKCIFDYN